MPTRKQQLSALRAARARTGLAAVPDIVPEPPPTARPTLTSRTAATVTAMPAEQPSKGRKTAPTTASGKAGTFPARLTLQLTATQADALDELCRGENRKLRDAVPPREQVYTVSGLIRAALDVCMSDPKLLPRMLRAAAEPRLSGRGGIGTRRPS